MRKPKRPPFTRRGEQAIQAFQEAEIADGMVRTEVGDDIVYTAEARLARARGETVPDTRRTGVRQRG
jgi:hypothetical protein